MIVDAGRTRVPTPFREWFHDFRDSAKSESGSILSKTHFKMNPEAQIYPTSILETPMDIFVMYKKQNMPHQSLIDSNESTIGLVLSWTAAGVTYILNMINMEMINSGLVTITTCLAVIFTVLKIRGQRIANRNGILDQESKRLDNELKRKKLDQYL